MGPISCKDIDWFWVWHIHMFNQTYLVILVKNVKSTYIFMTYFGL